MKTNLLLLWDEWVENGGVGCFTNNRLNQGLGLLGGPLLEAVVGGVVAVHARPVRLLVVPPLVPPGDSAGKVRAWAKA